MVFLLLLGFFGLRRLCLYYLRSCGPSLAVMVLAATPLFRKLYGRLPESFTRILTPVLTVLSLLLCTAYLVDSTYNPFLYFRF